MENSLRDELRDRFGECLRNTGIDREDLPFVLVDIVARVLEIDNSNQDLSTAVVQAALKVGLHLNETLTM